MQGKVGERLVGKTAHAGERRLCRRQFVGVAQHAAYAVEKRLAIRRRWRKWDGHWNCIETHEGSEVYLQRRNLAGEIARTWPRGMIRWVVSSGVTLNTHP